MVDFGKRLKDLRMRSGLTQKQLAEKLGITKSVVSYYELSERNPSPEILVKLSAVFHVSTDFLLGLEKTADTPLDLSGLSQEDISLLQLIIDALRQRTIKASIL